MSDFKVGDKVAGISRDEYTGTIEFIYATFHHEEYAVIRWGSKERSWHLHHRLAELKHYKEPLKYSTGEEPRVGDLVYHPFQKLSAEVLIVNEKVLEVFVINRGGRGDWRNLKFVELKRRKGY